MHIDHKSLRVNIKKLQPYLILIAIYFFFVNIEAQKQRESYKRNEIVNEEEDLLHQIKTNTKDSSYKISIPVVPFK